MVQSRQASQALDLEIKLKCKGRWRCDADTRVLTITSYLERADSFSTEPSHPTNLKLYAVLGLLAVRNHLFQNNLHAYKLTGHVKPFLWSILMLRLDLLSGKCCRGEDLRESALKRIFFRHVSTGTNSSFYLITSNHAPSDIFLDMVISRPSTILFLLWR